MATIKVFLDKNFDGEVVVDGETVLVHNAVAQQTDLRDEDYAPSRAAVARLVARGDVHTF